MSNRNFNKVTKEEAKRRPSLFGRLMIKIGLKDEEKEKGDTDDEEEPDPPNFIPVAGFTQSKIVYDKPFKHKDIKSIYKRLTPQQEPDFIDVIICTPVEKITKMQDDYPFLGLRKFMYHIKASINMICLSIIKHPLFEASSLLVIILNSVVLALGEEDEYPD